MPYTPLLKQLPVLHLCLSQYEMMKVHVYACMCENQLKFIICFTCFCEIIIIVVIIIIILLITLLITISSSIIIIIVTTIIFNRFRYIFTWIFKVKTDCLVYYEAINVMYTCVL